MTFEKMTAEQYRSLDHDAFEARKQAVQDALLDPECEVDVEVLREETRAIKAEAERRELAHEMRSLRVREVASGKGQVIDTTRADEKHTVEQRANDPMDTEEYRSAFLDYLNTGKRTPNVLRDGSGMLTTDAPVAIPTTLSNLVIEKLEDYDDIYAMVSKTNLQGGVEYAIDEFDFETKWVGEEEVTDWQKASRDQKISFLYHEFESRVQWSFLSGIVTMDNFTSKFQPKMSKSIAKTLSQGVIRGSGTGQMLGIVNDARIEHVIEMTEADFKSWKAWHSIFDADIDPEYDDGTIMMAKSSWNKYIDTMSDANDAPVNYAYDPVTGKRTNLLVGYQTQLVRPATLPDWDKAAPGDVVGIYGDLSNYTVNWQPGGNISIMRYPDWDTRKNKLVGYGVCDGKVVDPYGFVLIKKKASA